MGTAEQYCLGLDAGGTKTFCLVSDGAGRILGFGKAGPGNYEYKGVEAAAKENREAVMAALADAGLGLEDIAAAGLGVAGADVPEDYEMLEERIFTPLLGAIPRVFRNDSMAALRAGTRDYHGVVMIAGTGSNCSGRNREGREAGAGGLGPDFGDRGSGLHIGEEGLQAVWQVRDGLISADILPRRIAAHAGCTDADDLFAALYHGRISRDALEPLAPVVAQAAWEGCPAACDVLEQAGRHLGATVNAVARRLEMNQTAFDVVLAGGVYKSRSPVLIDAMRLTVRRESPDARLVRPEYEPVVGALLLALETVGPVDAGVYAALDASLDAAAERHGVPLRAG